MWGVGRWETWAPEAMMQSHGKIMWSPERGAKGKAPRDHKGPKKKKTKGPYKKKNGYKTGGQTSGVCGLCGGEQQG